AVSGHLYGNLAVQDSELGIRASFGLRISAFGFMVRGGEAETTARNAHVVRTWPDYWRPSLFRLVSYSLETPVEQRVGYINRNRQPAQSKAGEFRAVERLLEPVQRNQELQRRADILEKAESRKLQMAHRGAKEQQRDSG